MRRQRRREGARKAKGGVVVRKPALGRYTVLQLQLLLLLSVVALHSSGGCVSVGRMIECVRHGRVEVLHLRRRAGRVDALVRVHDILLLLGRVRSRVRVRDDGIGARGGAIGAYASTARTTVVALRLARLAVAARHLDAHRRERHRTRAAIATDNDDRTRT